MRFLNIDHIGIAVADFDAAVATYTQLHGAPPTQLTTIASEHVRVACFAVGASRLELLGSTDAAGPLGKFLATRGPGLHHICYAVADIEAAIATLRAEGFTPIERPTLVGAHGGRIAFFHPRELHGVLIELAACDSQNEPRG